MSQEPVVEFQNLGLQGSLGGRWLVQGLSGSVGAGEILLVTGASGSGKTTLLRLLAGLVSPTVGEVRWDGRGLDQMGAGLRDRVAWVTGQPRLLGQTVGQALLYPLELQGWEASAAAVRRVELCDRFEVPEDWLDRRQEQLSGSDALWVTIVRGLMVGPGVLLLDEVLEGLGADRRGLLLGLLLDYVGEGISLVVGSGEPLLWRGIAEGVRSQVLVLGPGQRACSEVNWDGLSPGALVDPEWD